MCNVAMDSIVGVASFSTYEDPCLIHKIIRGLYVSWTYKWIGACKNFKCTCAKTNNMDGKMSIVLRCLQNQDILCICFAHTASCYM